MKKRSSVAVLCVALVVLFAMSLAVSAACISVHLFRPDSIVKMLPYDYIMQHILYDHIVYNGVDYYITDPDVIDHIRKGKFTVEYDCVILVDADGVPYDEGRAEDAWILEDDPDVVYLQFNSATYTRNKELALP